MAGSCPHACSGDKGGVAEREGGTPCELWECEACSLGGVLGRLLPRSCCLRRVRLPGGSGRSPREQGPASCTAEGLCTPILPYLSTPVSLGFLIGERGGPDRCARSPAKPHPPGAHPCPSPHLHVLGDWSSEVFGLLPSSHPSATGPRMGPRHPTPPPATFP